MVNTEMCIIALIGLFNTVCCSDPVPAGRAGGAHAVAGATEPRLDDWDVVLTVDGEPVVWREFRQMMGRHKARIYSHFHQHYAMLDNAAFWTTAHDGETPLDMIKQRVRHEIVRVKVNQILAREYGVLPRIHYEDFIRRWHEENNRRRQVVSERHAVYGPRQYTESAYFNYIYENMLIRLKEKLGQGPFEITEDRLRELYNRDKNRKYRKRDTVRLGQIAACWNPRSQTRNCSSRQEAERLIQQARQRIQAGEGFDQVAKSINASRRPYEQTFDHEGAMAEVQRYPSFVEQALRLNVGDVSEVIEEPRMQMLVILRVIDKRTAGYLPFEEMRSYIKHRHIDEQYDDLVADRLKNADVRVNESIWARIRAK
ncbi:MAG TPA: peptidyl-prolyl cis-trans isomerase [Halothiobacillaceae bacterium]|nr:peptidyl-prolyl cis-trans isomerase [Halothiobacillaceae bacterium]